MFGGCRTYYNMTEILEEDQTAPASALRKAKECSVRSRAIYAVKIAFILLLLILIYYPIFVWMWQRWFATDSYYSHGPLIPVVSIALIWLRRQKLANASVTSSKLGLGLLVAGLILHIASASARVYFSSAYSFLIVLLGLILYSFGREVTRVIFFPLCFLIFMIPAPMAVVSASALKMKLFTAHISVSIIQLFGTPAVREGSMVHMPNTSTVVGDPCSGLRSLISLTALGVLYAYIVKASYPRKAVLLLSSIPIAVIANMIRTVAVLLIANSYGNEIITDGVLHKGFGLMVFVIAFAGLFLAGRLLGCRIPQKDT